jgi:hypothetical protein
MDEHWLLTQLSLQAPGFWLFASFLSNLLTLLLTRRFSVGQRQLLLRAQWVLIPYLGLLFGGLSPRLMGLAGINWLVSLSLGLVLIFVVLVLLVIVRAVVDLDESDHSRSEIPPVPSPDGPTHEPGVALRPGVVGWRALGSTTLVSGIKEFHWVFLRGAVWEILLTYPSPPELPGYWAVWVAALIALVELLLQNLGFTQRLLQVAILIATSILFFYTNNFWLCWILHATGRLIISTYDTAQAPRATPVGSKPK